MSSSNSVRLGMFYQFLSQRFNSSEDMVSAMDGCWTGETDGVVIKGEFQTFMKENWDCFDGQELTDRDINIFWRNMDTQQSAKKLNGTRMKDLNGLNETELQRVNQQLAAYEVLNRFMENVNLPSEVAMLGLNNREFKNSINASLMETCQEIIKRNSNLSTSDLEALLQQELTNAYPNALKKTIANMVAQKAVTDLSNLPELSGLDTHAFEDLQGLIDSYIRNRATSDDFDINAGGLNDLINEIRYIVKKYFEDAQVNSNNINATQIYTGYSQPGDVSHLSEYTLDPASGYSDLQTARIKEKLMNALSASGANYSSVQEYFDYYLGEFVNEKISSNVNFATLFNTSDNALKTEFFSSTHGQKLSLHKIVEEQYRDITKAPRIVMPTGLATISRATSATINILQPIHQIGNFYNKLKEEFGEAIADSLVENDIYSDAYTNIINSIHPKIKSGELTSVNDIENYIIEQMRSNMEDMIGGATSSMSIQEMYEIYLGKVNAAEGDTTLTGGQRLEKLRAAAIEFCDAACTKGTGAVNAVKSVFGDDYETTINSSQANVIKNGIEELKNALLQLETNNELSGPNTDNIAEVNGYEGIKRLGGNGDFGKGYYYQLSNAIDDAKTNLKTLLEEMEYKLSLAGYDDSVLNAAVSATLADYDSIFSEIDNMKATIKSYSTASVCKLASSATATFGVIRDTTPASCDDVLAQAQNLVSGNSGLIISCASSLSITYGWRIDIDQSVLFEKLLEKAGIQNENVDNTDSTAHIDSCSFGTCFYSEFKNESGWATDSQKAIQSFRTTVGQALYDAAIKDHKDLAVARNAMNTLNSYYENAIKALNSYFSGGMSNIDKNTGSNEGTSFSYQDYSTNPPHSVSVNDKSCVRVYGRENQVNELSDFTSNGLSSGTGLYVGCDRTGTDAFAFFVDPAVVIAKFKSFLG